MSQSPANSDTWSFGKWVLVIVFLTGVQFVLLKLFTVDVSGKSSHDFTAGTSLVMVSLPPTDALSYVALKDPTLLVLPDPKGLSGQSWLKPVEFTNSFTRWDPVDQWLDTSQFVSPSENSPGRWQDSAFAVSLAEKIQPPEEGPDYAPDRSDSYLGLGQNPYGRKIKSHPELPEFEFEGLVRPTTVEIFVNESGQVISAITVGPSDYLEANVLATRLANKIRFSPAPEEYDGTRAKRVDSVEVVFHWRTRVPSAPAPETLQP